MEQPQGVPLTAEENELIARWLERPAEERTLDQVPDYARWVVEHRPDLLPKGRDDATEYLARLLGDRVQGPPDGSAPEPSTG